MGPHSFKCGSKCAGDNSEPHRARFNGAALFQVRKCYVRMRSNRRSFPASMGPHSFKCGSSASISTMSACRACFNGAALFQVRKFSHRRRRRRVFPASMGPHSFKCGSPDETGAHAAEPAASMGPHSFKCGSTTSFGEITEAEKTLQWGRTLSSAEVYVNLIFSYKGSTASMGPHSFKCGSQTGHRNLFRWLNRFNGAALFQVRK